MSLSRDPKKEQGENPTNKKEKKKQRGKKCKEANQLLKCPSVEIPELGPPREVLPTPFPVNNVLSLLEFQRLEESIESRSSQRHLEN
jgi:hypothetical protein